MVVVFAEPVLPGAAKRDSNRVLYYAGQMGFCPLPLSHSCLPWILLPGPVPGKSISSAILHVV